MAVPSTAGSRWDEVGCPVCGEKDIWSFFEAANVPVRDGLLWDSAREAAAAPTGDLRLSVCRTCFYIGNEDYRPDMAGSARCDFSLQHSPSFRRFVRALSARLIERYRLKKTTVLDVGSGDGFFLRTICSMGRNSGVGIEPGFVQQETSPDCTVKTIRDRFSERQAARTRFGLIACRHVLSEIDQPKELLVSIRRGIRNPACLVYLEVPNAAHTFGQRLFWNLVYEHRSWYLPAGLTNLCQVAGLEVQDVRACWKREYLSAVAVRASASSQRRRTFVTASLESLQSFRTEWAGTVEQWQARLAAWRRSGVRVVAWGAGARAVTFAGSFDCRGVIDTVVDINPIRWGKYLPVSAIRVAAPPFIQTFKPDVILITNPTYTSEIQAHVARLGVRCAFDRL